ncbi:MAG: hypothetical protein WCQ77_04030 [Planctomycetota bacterium]
MKIIHIIKRFSSAGPERAIMAAARYAAKRGLQQEHVVCTLEPAGSPVVKIMARQSGVEVLPGLDEKRRADLLAQPKRTRAWSDDPYLRLWTGLALAQRGDAARAGQAFQAAATWGVRR